MTDLDYKREFFRKHGGMERVETSPMNEYDNYVKTYWTCDGKGVLTEVNGPAWQTVHWTGDNGQTMTTTEKVWKTEIWHTDNAASKVWYGKY